MPARVPVTAVLVAHDGRRWLPQALAALRAQTVEPARLIAVDTGSDDDCASLLRHAAGHVLDLPPTTTYAAAVAAALAAVPADTTWVWLLHDDCAPDADALSVLLRAAAATPSAAMLGPKVVDWDDPRLLVEMGCTTDGSGVRDPGVETGELDQGQHDAARDVLAVGTAGALVRRSAWDAVGGLDPHLALRDDVDLGWRLSAGGHRVVVVPQARVRHARAVTTGRRRLDSADGTAAAADRRAALHVVLANTAGWRLALALPRLVVACLLRAILLLLARDLRGAADELSALGGVLSQPRRLHRARRAAAATRTVAPRAVRPLMSSPATRARARAVAFLDRRSDRPVPALDDPAAPPPSWRSRLSRRPGLSLAAALALVTLAAARSLIGSGQLIGGRLVAPPEGARDLWQGYAATADPALAVLALPATLLLGMADLAVDLLVLGAVPVSGVVGYAVTRHVVSSALLRVWAGATWALLPVATGAVAAGRLDALVAHALVPVLLLGAYRLLRGDPRRVGWSRAWASGLVLTVAAALSPLLWLLLAAGTVATAVAATSAGSPAQRPAARRRLLGCALAAAVPALLLLPWSPELLSPARLLHGFGRLGPGLADPLLPAWDLLLLSPGGPGAPPLLVTAGLVLAALGGLLRTRRASVAAAGWALALGGLLVALVLARITVDGQPVWPGVPLDVAAAGMLVAALIGGEGLQEGLQRASFGWRQLTAVLVVVAAAALPVLAAASWVARAADGPVVRDDREVLPAFARAELAAAPGLRALLLSTRPDGAVGYTVAGADGPRLGAPTAELDEEVGALLSVGGADAADAVARQGIAFVALAGDAATAALLDAQPGLSRQPEAALWRVEATPRPAPAPEAAARLLPLQALAVLVVAVLAGPGLPPRRGLERQQRR